MIQTDQEATKSIVWMHTQGKVIAVAAFDEDDLAQAYAAYSNRRNPARYFEIRKESWPSA